MRSATLSQADKRDHRKAGPERQLEIEPVMHHQHGRGLADDREPAQPHQRVEPHVAAAACRRLVEEHRACVHVRLDAASLMRATRANAPAAAAIVSGSACDRPRRNVTSATCSRPCRPPSPSTAWSRSTRPPPRSTAFRSRLRRGSITGAARRQRRRQDHHHRDDHGAGRRRPPARVARARRRHAARAPSRAAPDEFREPLCRHADAADRAAEPEGVRHALWRRATSQARIATLAEELDLTDFLDRPTGKLSAGQKTRVSLAKSLINQPELLLLDEPTASLDPDTADWVRGAARTLSRRARRHHAARLAQHGRGRAPVRARHHDEAAAGSRTTTRRRGCSRATAATRWRRCSSTSRAGAARRARRRNERATPRNTSRFSPRRVGAMVLRYWYLLRSSWPRAARADLLAGGADADVGLPADLPRAALRASSRRPAARFIGAVLLWDILFRGQLGFSISFLEEM